MSERCIISFQQEGETLFDADSISLDPKPECANRKLEETVLKKRRRKRWNKAVNEVGLRFDKTVPVETVILANDTTKDIAEADRELINEHVFHKLATPANYRNLRCVTPIYKRRATNEFVSPPVPPAVI